MELTKQNVNLVFEDNGKLYEGYLTMFPSLEGITFQVIISNRFWGMIIWNEKTFGWRVDIPSLIGLEDFFVTYIMLWFE